MTDITAARQISRNNPIKALKYLNFSNKYRVLLLGAAAVLILGGGRFAAQHMGAADAAPAAIVTPAIPVGVVTVNPGRTQIWSEFSGKLDAVDYAEIRPEVAGRITEIRFKEGQQVKAGDILFVIDPRPYQAAAAKAAAALSSARTNAGLAKTNLTRADRLREAGAIAQQAYDQTANEKSVADAAIAGAEAALTQAQLDVDHAYVKAPISGRISRAEITLGNLVQVTAGAPLLTSIDSGDGIYADFDVDEQTYVRNVRNQGSTLGDEQKIPVEMTRTGDTGHIYKGFIQSFDNHINTGSGTIRARARFDNADGTLLPGMFVSVRLANAVSADTLLVPERAIGTDQNKKFLYVVDKENKVAFQEVALGDSVDGQRVVLSGLKPGSRVIVDGIQHVVPGASVVPEDIEATVAAK